MKLSQTNGPLFKYYNTPYETLEVLKTAGFKYVDLSFWSRFIPGSDYFTRDLDEIADEYKAALDKLELIPVQSHEPFGNSMGPDGGRFYFKKTPRSIELAGKIGIPSITLHAGINVVPMTRDEYLDKNAEIFRQLIPTAEKYGIKLLLENLAWKIDGVHLATAQDMLDLLDRVGNHPLVGICWDCGHANLCGVDQYESIKTLGDKLWGLHIHDNLGPAAGIDMHVQPHWGNVNFDALITALLEIGYKGTFNFECDAPGARSNAIPFEKDGVAQEKLAVLPKEIRTMSETMLYQLGKKMLEAYDCFEE